MLCEHQRFFKPLITLITLMPSRGHVPTPMRSKDQLHQLDLRFKNTIVIALRASQLIFKRTTDYPDYPDVETPLRCVANISYISKNLRLKNTVVTGVEKYDGSLWWYYFRYLLNHRSISNSSPQKFTNRPTSRFVTFK